jgi:N-acetylglucosaminyldiphosphoundecaprenol N-acetyl-beta-D-mannosaminyltransferase
MNGFKRVDVLGCPFDAISFPEAVNCIRQVVLEDKCMQLCPGSIDFVMKARNNAQFARDLWQSDIVFADGVPIVWAASLLGSPIRGRVSGTDIVFKCAEISAEIGCTIALIGGNFALTERAAQRLSETFPHARLSPIPTPFPLGPKENKGLVEQVRGANAKILLVALGAPKQERWLRMYLKSCGANVGIGIGSAFDIISGDKPRAPKWMADHGFEWFYRMLLEPKRLGRRYLIDDSPFLYLLAIEIMKRKTYSKRGHI